MEKSMKSMKFVSKKNNFKARWSWGHIIFLWIFWEKGLTLWGEYKRKEKKPRGREVGFLMFNFFGHLKWKMSCPQERASICESKSLSSVNFRLFISKLWQNSKPIYHFSGGHISKSFGSIAFFTLTASFWDKLVSYPLWKKNGWIYIRTDNFQ